MAGEGGPGGGGQWAGLGVADGWEGGEKRREGWVEGRAGGGGGGGRLK